jgi:hypothetical protein
VVCPVHVASPLGSRAHLHDHGMTRKKAAPGEAAFLFLTEQVIT